MNILISKFNVTNVALLIAYVSACPDAKQQCRVLASYWSCRTLRHMFSAVHPILDTKSEQEVLNSIEPMTEIKPGLYASTARCQQLDKLAKGNFIDYAMCVNPQLFKLMEMAV